MGAAAALTAERHTRTSTHTGPTKSPYYYEILANLITIQTATDGDLIFFFTGALLLKWLQARDELLPLQWPQPATLSSQQPILPDWDAALNVAVLSSLLYYTPRR